MLAAVGSGEPTVNDPTDVWAIKQHWFEEAVDELQSLMLHFHAHPNYEPLRTHPRYPALLQVSHATLPRQPMTAVLAQIPVTS